MSLGLSTGAEHLTPDEITRSLRTGDFYASTGVILKDYQISGTQISIQVLPREAYREKYRIQFIGKNGKILQDKTAQSATYTWI